MVRQDNRAYSKVSKIRHVQTLSTVLDIPADRLVAIAGTSGEYWIAGKTQFKSNGEPRLTSNAKKPLKDIHEQIKNKLLKRVSYPRYLLGGIADRMRPRDYKRHAEIHSGKKILISEDIQNFFPSTSTELVCGIWQRFFNFHPEIASILTNLTTYQGFLPQGWKTSGYIANLAFWDTEPELVERLQSRGFAYSRFMDDITVSARRKIDKNDKHFVVSAIYQLLFRKNYSPKRSKHQIVGNNNRMQVTGLIVNSRKPTLAKSDRNIIRAMVHACEKYPSEGRSSPEYRQLYRKASGKVGMMSRFHPEEAGKLRARLRSVASL